MSLATRNDIDYRLVYLAERQVEDRVKDVYIAKYTQYKPPLFHEILEELVDLEAYLFVMHNKDAFSDLSEERRADLLNRIEAEDHEALDFVFSRIDKRFVEMFARDLMMMLLSSGYMFFEQDPLDKGHVEVRNSSIQSVW